MLPENLAGQRRVEKANLRKAVIGGNLAFGIGWIGANQSGSSSGKYCGKFLQENLVGKSWWKYSIWNRVMGSQPIRIQLGKILWENLVGNSCGKILREVLVGKSCGKILQENLAGKSCRKFCGKILQENLVGNSCGKILLEILVGNVVGKSCGTGWRGKSHFKKGIDWWKFSIWNRVMGSQPIRIQLGKILWENLAGNSCRKMLPENLAGQGRVEKANLNKAVIGGNLAFGIGWWEPTYQDPAWNNLVGNSCAKSCEKFCWKFYGKCCGTFPIPIPSCFWR